MGEPEKKTHAAVTAGGSALSRYQNVVIGRSGLLKTVYFELCAWLSIVPGALGLWLRKMLWRRLFGSCGSGAVFGANVTLRHPHRIHLGDRVVISEGVILDARNDGSDEVIRLGDDVMLANNTMISCKQGTVRIGRNVGLGAQTIVQSTNDCPVSIGDDSIVGPRCYIVGGGSYNIDRADVPIREQGIIPDGGCVLENDVWLGAAVNVLGGVTVKCGAVVAAGAVVNRDLESYSVNAGVPARKIKMRFEENSR
jgi:acetyltransferase-like isoleucine patch superfamily enzyme